MTEVVIPNSVMANSRLINYSSEDFRRVDLAFDVDYDCDIEYVKKLIEQGIPLTDVVNAFATSNKWEPYVGNLKDWINLRKDAHNAIIDA